MYLYSFEKPQCGSKSVRHFTLTNSLLPYDCDKLQKFLYPDGTDDSRVNGDHANKDSDENDESGDDDSTGNNDDADDDTTAEPLPVLSGLELYAQRQKKLRERKEKIASLSSVIVENPDENVSKQTNMVSYTVKYEQA